MMRLLSFSVSDLPKIEESMIRNIKDNGAEAGFSCPLTPHVVFILKSVKLSPPCTDSIWNTTDKFLLRTKERRRRPRSSASVTTERQIKVCTWLRETSSCSCLDWIRAPFCRRHGYGPRLRGRRTRTIGQLGNCFRWNTPFIL